MPDLIQLAIPAFIVLMVVEAVFDAVMRRDLYEPRDTAASLTMGMGNVLVGLVSKAMVFALFSWVHRFAMFQIGYQWWAWILAFFADDFNYYWFHRTSHECRFFWASHVVHHSSQRYNLSTALRQTWTGNLTGSFIFWFWMPLVGFVLMYLSWFPPSPITKWRRAGPSGTVQLMLPVPFAFTV